MYEAIEHYKVYKQRQDELQQAKMLFEECGFQYKEKAKKEMDKFLNKIIVKNGVTKYQYDKEIRKQMGRSNNGDINHNNDNNKMMKYPKIVGWSVVIGMWSIMGVSLHQMKKSEQQNKENIEVIAEEMIEWMYEDVENDRIPEWTAKEYINDLEQIIKEVK